MSLRHFSIAAALLLLAVFTLLNWSAFMAPTTLSLGLAEVKAPLGLIMLGVTVGVSSLFLVYILLQQASSILESRRSGKELKEQRQLAEQAEASRFTEMRAFLEAELRRMDTQASTTTGELAGRIDRMERQILQHLDESTRALSAYIGEVEDKLDRALPAPRAD